MKIDGKAILNTAYSLGAAIVIVGALFKLLHLKGASIMLTVGLLTEAGLFLVGIFEKPPVHYHWENVYPDLLKHPEGEDESREEEEEAFAEGLAQASHVDVGDNAQVSIAGDIEGDISLGGGGGGAQPKEVIPTIDGEVMEQVQENFQLLVEQTKDTVTRLGSLAEVTETFTELDGNVKVASSSIEVLANASGSLSEHMATANTNMEEVSAAGKYLLEGAQLYNEKVQEITQRMSTDMTNLSSSYESIHEKLNSWNAIYDMQVQVAQENLEGSKEINKTVSQISKSLTSVAKSSDANQKQLSDMSDKLEKLNVVYGNMLSSLE